MSLYVNLVVSSVVMIAWICVDVLRIGQNHSSLSCKILWCSLNVIRGCL